MIKSSNTPGSKEIAIDVVGSSTFSRYSTINSQKTYNMFVSDNWLVSFAGYKRVLDLVTPNAGEGRGLFNSVRGKFMLIVIGQKVFKISPTLAVEPLSGLLATSSCEVSID